MICIHNLNQSVLLNDLNYEIYKIFTATILSCTLNCNDKSAIDDFLNNIIFEFRVI